MHENTDGTATTNIYTLPLDMQIYLAKPLKFNDVVNVMNTCRQMHSLFKNKPALQKMLREKFIKEYLSDNPSVIKQFSPTPAFKQVFDDFLLPFQNIFFDVRKPGAITRTHKIFSHGKYKDKSALEVCIELGFEKLYLQTYRCHEMSEYDHYRNAPDFEQTVNNGLYRTLYWDCHLAVLSHSSDPFSFFMAMTRDVSPYLYFIALGASLWRGRVDVFDALLREFDHIHDYLLQDANLYEMDNAIELSKASSPPVNLTDLSVQSIKHWVIRFKCEFDRFTIPDYARRAGCETLFEMCMERFSQKESSPSLDFLWTCYTGDNSQIQTCLDQNKNLMESQYHYQFNETALSLYARNPHPEDEAVIATLLENKFLCDLMHERCEGKTPLQIALKNGKVKLAAAMMQLTSAATMLSVYTKEEIQMVRLDLATPEDPAPPPVFDLEEQEENHRRHDFCQIL